MRASGNKAPVVFQDDTVYREAELSEDGLYRYSLTRRFGYEYFPRYSLTRRFGCEYFPYALFIMLNPSTADGTVDDQTIRKCTGFTRQWGLKGFHVVNLFAYRTSSPAVLRDMKGDPVGKDNRTWVFRMVNDTVRGAEAAGVAPTIVCGWGNNGVHRQQDRTMMSWLKEWDVRPMCLKTSTTGTPYHPLYVPFNTPLIPYSGRPL